MILSVFIPRENSFKKVKSQQTQIFLKSKFKSVYHQIHFPALKKNN